MHFIKLFYPLAIISIIKFANQILLKSFLQLTEVLGWGYSRKKPNMRTYFFENPSGVFHVFTLPLEIPDRTKLHLWKFHKIVLATSLGNLKTSKSQDPWKFHMIFSWSPLEIPLCFKLTCQVFF